MDNPDLSKEYKDLAERWEWQVGSEQLGRLGRLREKFKKEKNLSELHPVIESAAKKAFKVCNITEPILTLQDNHSTSSACYRLTDEDYYPVKGMAIGAEDNRGSNPLPYIRATIFHECGHIKAGDVEASAFTKDLPFVLGVITASTYAGKHASKLLQRLPKPARIFGGVTTGIATWFGLSKSYQRTIYAYQTRKIERNADIFAIRKLIDLHDHYAIAYRFLDNTYNVDEGNTNWKNEYWLFHDHPGYLERAKIILDELKHANVDLNNLPLNSKLYDDVEGEPAVWESNEVQKRFTAQIKKHFPEYLEK